MYWRFLSALICLVCIVSYVPSATSSPADISHNRSLIVPASGNATNLNIYPRPILPYHVQIGESDISVQFMQYYGLLNSNNIYPCIIQALVEMYEAAIYDSGNAPLRGDSYTSRVYDVLIDVQRLPRSRPRLKYAAVVRMLQAVELFMHDYGTYGLALVIYDNGSQVGHAVVRQSYEFPTHEAV